VWTPWYADVDSAAGGVKDKFMQARDAKTGNTLREWTPDSPSVGEIRVPLLREQEIRMEIQSHVAFATDNDILTHLRYSCEKSMTLELTMPDTFAVQCEFHHPDADNSNVCSFTRDDVVAGYYKYTAKISGAVLPFQGLWLAWGPDPKQEAEGGD
jgi:hypothetical protein